MNRNLSESQFNPAQDTWFHTSEKDTLTNRKRAVSGATGGGLHLGTRDAGRHVRYEESHGYTTVSGDTVYPKLGRPYIHAFGVKGDSFSRSGDHGVNWPSAGPDKPTLYRNEVEDAGSESLWARPDHLEPRGVRLNRDVHVTDTPESTVYAQVVGRNRQGRKARFVEQLKLPGVSSGRSQWWEREEE